MGQGARRARRREALGRESLWQDRTTIEGKASGADADIVALAPEDAVLYVGDATYAVITINISYRTSHGTTTYPAVEIQIAPTRGGTWSLVGTAKSGTGDSTIMLAREPASGSTALRMDGAWLRWCVRQPATADTETFRITFQTTAVLS